jgi:hypothetical protein
MPKRKIRSRETATLDAVRMLIGAAEEVGLVHTVASLLQFFDASPSPVCGSPVNDLFHELVAAFDNVGAHQTVESYYGEGAIDGAVDFEIPAAAGATPAVAG